MEQAQVQVEFFTDDRHQDINANGNPHLSFHRVVARAEEVFNAQILLDPLKEESYGDAAHQLIALRHSTAVVTNRRSDLLTGWLPRVIVRRVNTRQPPAAESYQATVTSTRTEAAKEISRDRTFGDLRAQEALAAALALAPAILILAMIATGFGLDYDGFAVKIAQLTALFLFGRTAALMMAESLIHGRLLHFAPSSDEAGIIHLKPSGSLRFNLTPPAEYSFGRKIIAYAGYPFAAAAMTMSWVYLAAQTMLFWIGGAKLTKGRMAALAYGLETALVSSIMAFLIAHELLPPIITAIIYLFLENLETGLVHTAGMLAAGSLHRESVTGRGPASRLTTWIPCPTTKTS